MKTLAYPISWRPLPIPINWTLGLRWVALDLTSLNA